ncbi:hypothetical protein CO662_36795 [Rhizobium anhuiense]|uniref:Uncharacterized protein n=2 Tax=Rhizobium anhuiense TaxID=1184720 RepID=A0ABX4IW30_9HYPH|nr:hypothetical protein [Rhizobium anhuiense]PDS45185.1 hypothetical protein CO668_08750 [Rhizobium anhuiense]PDS45763.1 hypothetical protein CO662_36795 [Rhizobium anhuiense]
MFEEGQNYEFRLLEAGDEIMFWGIVESYEHPLIKLQETAAMTTQVLQDGASIAFVADPNSPAHPGRIINVTSPHFISAVKKQR